MGTAQSIAFEITNPEIPDQKIEAFLNAVNQPHSLRFINSWTQLDALSPLSFYAQRNKTSSESTSSTFYSNRYAESFVGKHHMMFVKRNSYIVLGRMQRDAKDVSHFWHANPLAQEAATMSKKMGVALSPQLQNEATHVSWILVPSKIAMFCGVAAPMMDKDGHWVPGGDEQHFIPKEVAKKLHHATLILLNGQHSSEIRSSFCNIPDYLALCDEAVAIQKADWKEIRAYRAKIRPEIKRQSKDQLQKIRQEKLRVMEEEKDKEIQIAKELDREHDGEDMEKTWLSEPLCSMCGHPVSENFCGRNNKK